MEGLDQNRVGPKRKTPSLKHTQKMHMYRHTNPNNLQASMQRYAPHILLLNTGAWSQECFCLPVGSPSQSDMAREGRGSGECLLLSAESLQAALQYLFSVCLTNSLFFGSKQPDPLYHTHTQTHCLAFLLYFVSPCPPHSLCLFQQSDQWLLDMPIKHHTLCYWTLNL